MTRYLVLQWNGRAWCVDNSEHAVVRAGPYDSEDEAHAAIDKLLAEEGKPVMNESPEEAQAYAARHIAPNLRVHPVSDWPMEGPAR